MRLLLDTHVILWWLDDSPLLSQKARSAIADPDNLVYVSAVSLWEIVLKRGLGKLALPDHWEQALMDEPFRRLPVTWEHALGLARLPEIHRDPFDRLLLAQAAIEGLMLVTQDEAVLRYEVPTFKA
jgi:PIN domain nuclease of toxin-antitoxin system